MEEESKLWLEFEEKFGFKTYEALQKVIYSYYRKIEDLKISRDKWKAKALKK